ncbi:MAG: DUF4832 domain-containing protein [Chloroflexota bacterium]
MNTKSVILTSLIAISILVCIWFISSPTALISQSVSDDSQQFLPTIQIPDTPTPVITQTISYQEETAFFLNPERGFFDQNAPFWFDDDRFVVDMSGLRDERVTLIRLYFLIDEYIDQPISDESLQLIDDNFAAAREAGVKVIPRFAYNFPNGPEYLNAQDAELDQLLNHIDQLAPILQKNGDVIAYMNLGFVGAWGEWHTSSNNHVDDDNGRQVNDNSRAIISKIFTTLPDNRMATMRYPLYKQQLYGPNPLTSTAAFSGSDQARMGGLNDCFLASETDFGTYWPNNSDADIEAYKIYMSADNLYLPMGGETCNNDEEAQPYVGCENALAELERMRWDTLHNGYLVDVLDGWRQEGCFDEIESRLGYRFVLEQGTFPESATAGDAVQLNLVVRNDGFGAPYNPRGFELILRNAVSGQEVAIPLNDDPRLWLPGQIQTLTLSPSLPAGMATGEYQLFLNLPDPEETLKNNPSYSIRLANTNVWEPATGYNSLDATIQVDGS